MSYTCAIYNEQGGEKAVIGGTVLVRPGAKVILEEGASVEGLPCAENQAASTATTVANLTNDFNALLAKLKAAGIVAPDSK